MNEKYNKSLDEIQSIAAMMHSSSTTSAMAGSSIVVGGQKKYQGHEWDVYTKHA
jgi:hypothetical protein